jgi:hypothetical protein
MITAYQAWIDFDCDNFLFNLHNIASSDKIRKQPVVAEFNVCLLL